jgi:hypothetical protein
MGHVTLRLLEHRSEPLSCTSKEGAEGAIGIGLLVLGAVFATAGAFLIVGAIRRVRRASTT